MYCFPKKIFNRFFNNNNVIKTLSSPESGKPTINETFSTPTGFVQVLLTRFDYGWAPYVYRRRCDGVKLSSNNIDYNFFFVLYTRTWHVQTQLTINVLLTINIRKQIPNTRPESKEERTSGKNVPIFVGENMNSK